MIIFRNKSILQIKLHKGKLCKYYCGATFLRVPGYYITGLFGVVFNLAFFGECPSTPN